MLVTVITPSFNSGSYIEDTIRSVAEQDYGSLDHIVLDSNSTDATHDVLARWPGVQVIRDAPPTIAGKINLGFQLARETSSCGSTPMTYLLPAPSVGR